MEYLVVLGFQPYDLFVAPIEMLTAGAAATVAAAKQVAFLTWQLRARIGEVGTRPQSP
jgi:hypothetical protein